MRDLFLEMDRILRPEVIFNMTNILISLCPLVGRAGTFPEF